MQYLFNLGMRNMRLDTLRVKSSPIYGARREHGCGKSADAGAGKILEMGAVNCQLVTGFKLRLV